MFLGETLQDKRDAFYVCDLGDIIRKYKHWVTQLPRVEPFYGNYVGPTVSVCLYYPSVIWSRWSGNKSDILLPVLSN